jgi:glucose uptake protein GlcU
MIKKTLLLISLGLLLYLLADNFMHIDFAVSKNNAFTSMKKQEVDSASNIDTVKQIAKGYLDTIRNVHKKYSHKSVINFWLLALLIIIQVFLFVNKQSRKEIENNQH